MAALGRVRLGELSWEALWSPVAPGGEERFAHGALLRRSQPHVRVYAFAMAEIRAQGQEWGSLARLYFARSQRLGRARRIPLYERRRRARSS